MEKQVSWQQLCRATADWNKQVYFFFSQARENGGRFAADSRSETGEEEESFE